MVKENAVPKFHKPRSVPDTIRGAIEKDLETLVIEKTNHSEWAAPIVPVLLANFFFGPTSDRLKTFSNFELSNF